MTELREATTDERYFPLIGDVKVHFHFPYEVTDASLVSSYPNMGQQAPQAQSPLMGARSTHGDQGIFNFDQERRQGEWSFDPSLIMKNDEDKSCEKAVLRGCLKVSPILSNNQSSDERPGVNAGLSAQIIADVTLSIKKYTFSGARVDRVAINQDSGTSIRNFKDDDGINRQVRTMSLAKSVQYRF